MNNNIKNTRGVVIKMSKYLHGKILDFGAGTAKYQSLIKPHASSYTTFDLIPGPKIDVVGNALMSPFDDEIFDTVVCTQVFEHVEEPWIMAKEIGRLVRKGGTVIITAPFMQPFHPDPSDFFRYTKVGLESLFIREGFDIIESGTYGKAFSVIADMVNFSRFGRYEKGGRTVWGNRISNLIEKVAGTADRFVESKTIYSNVYVVAKKK